MRHESSRKRPPDSDLGGRTTRRHSPTHRCYSPSLSGRIAMRLLYLARLKWPSKADGRETLVDAAGAPPGFPLVPTPLCSLHFTSHPGQSFTT